MRALVILSGLIVAGHATLAAADSVSSTSGPGASVSIVSGNNGGTTIVIDSRHPCRTESGKTAARRSSGGNSTTITSGAGGLSGTTTAGPSGTSVTISPGSGGSATTASSGTNVAAAGECVVIIRDRSGR